MQPQQGQYPPAGYSTPMQNGPKKSNTLLIIIIAATLALIAIIILVVALVDHNSVKHNQPTAPGYGECDAGSLSDGSSYGQIAISDGASCTTAESVIEGAASAAGAAYKSNGYSCTATKEGSGTQWSSYWGDATFYAYDCINGNKQVAFNWQSASAGSNESTPSSSSTPSTPANSTNSQGQLQPTEPGDGECGAGATYGQIAISGNATCTVAESIVQGAASAAGAAYKSNGYSCTATKEGSGTEWSSYWSDNTFYLYTCSNGSDQVAFNWQSASASTST
jgi:hypothetical protein